MKKRVVELGLLAVAITLVIPVGTTADVLIATPTEVAALGGDEQGVAGVLVRFELTGMRQGAGREIHAAHVNWNLGDLSGDQAHFHLKEVAESWNPIGVGLGTTPESRGETERTWELESLDLSRIGGLVRFDVRDLVTKWLADPAENFGVVIATEDASPAALEQALGTLRLEVRYGFSGGGAPK